MFKISFWHVSALITILWVFARYCVWKKYRKTAKQPTLSNEVKLLMFYACIIILARIVYFPWHHINGRIGALNFNFQKLFPPRVNLIPFVHLVDNYAGWQMNIIGNISMFIPVGIFLPACFKQLKTVWKTIIAGSSISLFIEITQLMFYERCSDVDDLIMNTTGVLIGALIYFGNKKIKRIRQEKAVNA